MNARSALFDLYGDHVRSRGGGARVAALVPDIAVLYLSGYTGQTVLARGAREEGVASLQKPFTPRALAMRVREVLDDATREARTG